MHLYISTGAGADSITHNNILYMYNVGRVGSEQIFSCVVQMSCGPGTDTRLTAETSTR